MTGEALQQALVARRGQARVAQVVVEVEVRVVHPHGVAGQRHARDALAVARHQQRLDERLEAFDVDAALGPAERAGVEDRHRADVHHRPVVFDLEEDGVDGGEALVVGSGTRGAGHQIAFTAGLPRFRVYESQPRSSRVSRKPAPAARARTRASRW